jgi:hypothetical protein
MCAPVWSNYTRHCPRPDANLVAGQLTSVVLISFLTTNWTTGVRSSTEAKEIFSSLCVQTSAQAGPASCPTGTEGSFPGGKPRPRRDANHSHHPVPRSRMSRSYSPLTISGCMAVARQLYVFTFLTPFILFKYAK